MRVFSPILILLLVVLPASACPIPVFRYALEFWEPDPYVVEITRGDGLSADARAAIDLLGQYTEDGDPPANFDVRIVDTEPMTVDSPRLTVYRPGAERDPIWSAPLTRATAEQLVDSPARREITRQLLEGESAVWVLLESGDRQADEATLAILHEELEILETTLRLPEELLDQANPNAFTASEPELRLSFSILRVSRDDPAEATLIAMLTASEPRPINANEPIVVPVFGRGRALGALVGADVNAAKIAAFSRFLVGPCSCLAKELNPGHDLLMAANWEAELSASLLAVVDLPPLVGLSTLTEAADNAERNAASTQPTVTSTPLAAPAATVPTPSGVLSGLLRNMLIALGIIMAVVAFLIVRATRHPAKDRS